MQKEYNTQEIREAAGKLDKLSGELQHIQIERLPQISKMATPLVGETSNALQDEIRDLQKLIALLRSKLDGSSSILYEFARRLDIADEKTKQLIESK